MKGYLPLIGKDYITHMHGVAVYVKEGFPFARGSSLENCRFLFMFTTGFALLSVFFFFYQSPSSSLYTVFDLISSNIEEF